MLYVDFVKSQHKNDFPDMHYLIPEENKDVKHLVDGHELGLFEVDKTLEIMKQAGFQTKFLDNGLTRKERGSCVGIKE